MYLSLVKHINRHLFSCLRCSFFKQMNMEVDDTKEVDPVCKLCGFHHPPRENIRWPQIFIDNINLVAQWNKKNNNKGPTNAEYDEWYRNIKNRWPHMRLTSNRSSTQTRVNRWRNPGSFLTSRLKRSGLARQLRTPMHLNNIEKMYYFHVLEGHLKNNCIPPSVNIPPTSNQYQQQNMSPQQMQLNQQFESFNHNQ